MYLWEINIIINKEHLGVCPECSRCSWNATVILILERNKKQFLDSHKVYIPRPLWTPQFSNVPLLFHDENNRGTLHLIQKLTQDGLKT